MIGSLLRGLGIVFTPCVFFYGMLNYDKQTKYQEKCQQAINLNADDDEKTFALTGFFGRSFNSIFNIVWNTLSGRDKFIVATVEQNAVADAKNAAAQIEKFTDVSNIEKKYCKNIPGIK